MNGISSSAFAIILGLLTVTAVAAADPLNCDLAQSKAQRGITASVRQRARGGVGRRSRHRSPRALRDRRQHADDSGTGDAPQGRTMGHPHQQRHAGIQSGLRSAAHYRAAASAAAQPQNSHHPGNHRARKVERVLGCAAFIEGSGVRPRHIRTPSPQWKVSLASPGCRGSPRR